MHYLIDLDNTLLNTFLQAGDGKKHFYWATNLQRDLNINPNTLNLLFNSKFMNLLQTTADIYPLVDIYLKNIYSPVSSTEFIDYWLNNNSNVNTSLLEWIKKQKRKNHIFHIASDQPHIRMNFLWNKFKEWHDIFDMVFTSANFNVIFKDDQRFFELVLKHLQEPASNICLIDDNIANIEVAQKMGIKTILFDGSDNFFIE